MAKSRKSKSGKNKKATQPVNYESLSASEEDQAPSKATPGSYQHHLNALSL